MNLSIQLEPFGQALPEMQPYFDEHWKELALNQDKISLAVDYERYQQLADMGVLRVITVRDDGKLIGYHWVLVCPHLHYKNTVYAMTDVYFVKREYRRGNVGIKMFQESERILKYLGVRVMAIFTKSDVNPGVEATLEYAGFKKAESVYFKLVEGD